MQSSFFFRVYSYEAHYSSFHRNTCLECRRTFPSNFLLDLHILENHDVLFELMSNAKYTVNIILWYSIVSVKISTIYDLIVMQLCRCISCHVEPLLIGKMLLNSVQLNSLGLYLCLAYIVTHAGPQSVPTYFHLDCSHLYSTGASSRAAQISSRMIMSER